MSESPKPLVIGVGNEYRHDDGVGNVVARELRKMLSDCDVVEASGEGAELMDLWDGREEVYLIDAVLSGSSPGAVVRIEAQRESVPGSFFHYSTHAFSVAEAIELARTLGTLPRRIILFGIEGEDFAQGTGITPAVQSAAIQVLQTIVAELK